MKMPTSKKRKKAAERVRRQKEAAKDPKAKAEKKTQRNQLAEQNSMLQQGLISMRHQYDQAVMERESLRQQIAQRDQLLTAAAVVYGEIIVDRDILSQTLDGTVAGYNLDLGTEADDPVVLTPVYPEDIEEEEDADEE